MLVLQLICPLTGTGLVLTRLEDCRHSNGGANSLSEEDLPIAGAQAGHHDAKDMQDASDEHQPSWTIVVEQGTNDWTLQR
jgi:hypothetical protein